MSRNRHGSWFSRSLAWLWNVEHMHRKPFISNHLHCRYGSCTQMLKLFRVVMTDLSVDGWNLAVLSEQVSSVCSHIMLEYHCLLSEPMALMHRTHFSEEIQKTWGQSRSWLCASSAANEPSQSHRWGSLNEKQSASISLCAEITCSSNTELTRKPCHPSFGLFVLFCFSAVTSRADNLDKQDCESFCAPAKADQTQTGTHAWLGL